MPAVGEGYNTYLLDIPRGEVCGLPQQGTDDP